MVLSRRACRNASSVNSTSMRLSSTSRMWARSSMPTPLARGQSHTERGAGTGRGLHPNTAAQQFQGPPDGCQADTGPRVVLLAVQPLEHVEDLVVELRGNPDAVVADSNDHLGASPLPIDCDGQRRVGAAIHHGVVEQVAEY